VAVARCKERRRRTARGPVSACCISESTEALRGRDFLSSERIRYLDHVGETGHRLFKIAEELGLEGIVAKHGGAPYRRGACQRVDKG
jgi:ATP-dependent DNA ligase